MGTFQRNLYTFCPLLLFFIMSAIRYTDRLIGTAYNIHTATLTEPYKIAILYFLQFP